MSEEKATRRERREAARLKMKELRRALKDARARKKDALREAKERCRAERIAARERARALRIRLLEEMREAVRSERAAARKACAERLSTARALVDDVARARAAYTAEQSYQRSMRDIARQDQKRKEAAPAVARLATNAETDQEVRAALPSDLVPLFDRVARSIKAKGRVSRTEAFLKYAETHPDEVLAASSHPADVRVRDLEVAHRAAAKEAGTPVSAYEQKKAARIERMRKRADHLASEAAGAEQAARRIADAIPLGQPVLIGHHSQRRHERDIQKIRRGYGKAHALAKEAEALRTRAERAERSTAVSSDDPEAIAKLKEQLELSEKRRARMVAANKAIRGPKPREALLALGFYEGAVDTLLTPDALGKIGFAGWQLSNAAADARRLKARIQELEARRTKPPSAISAPGVRVEEGENRVRIVFDAKPPEEVRRRLKAEGFRWSPTAGAWQRFAGPAAWHAAKRALGLGAAAPPPSGGASCGCAHGPEATP